MNFFVRFFPEIIIKSREVRNRYIAILRRSLRTQLKLLDPQARVDGGWDHLSITTELRTSADLEKIVELLTHTPGLDRVMQIEKFPLSDLDGVVALAVEHNKEAVAGKSFAVRCKRSGKQHFTSMDVERRVGAALLESAPGSSVKLKDPQVQVRVDILKDEVAIVKKVYDGLGGYPLGTQDAVLSLISGGFDSTVSSYQCIKRGLLTHFCFFRLGGAEHEFAVKEVALYLWMKYGASHRVKFVTVPFEDVVNEIVSKVESSQMGVIFKRMMYRAASGIADKLKVETLITGESVAQVSSQTLANLAIIDRVTDKLVLRPLAMLDKREIIDVARQIGSEEFVKNIPEYCGVISVKPTTRARIEKIERQEELFNNDVLLAAIDNAEIQMIDRVMEGHSKQSKPVQESSIEDVDSVIIDIRHPDEQEKNPLDSTKFAQEILVIPFYELPARFASLPSQYKYALYCDKGIMSRLHASHLQQLGHANVAVFVAA